MVLEESTAHWSFKDGSNGRPLSASIFRSGDGDRYHLELWANIGTEKQSRSITVKVQAVDFTAVAKYMIQADRKAAVEAFAKAMVTFG